MATWVLLVIAGFAMLGLYETTPGAQAAIPQSWPDDLALPRADDRATLLMFVHPQCPCTRATLAELERLIARCHDRLTVKLYFVEPAAVAGTAQESSLWAAASRLPNVELAVDPDGRLASRFGATTSGHVVLYDEAGRLAYAGGITSARGHEGDNAGRLAIEHMLLAGNESNLPSELQPVYGCPLQRSDAIDAPTKTSEPR